MKMRKFFHIIAVMFSSFAALISHGRAQDTTQASNAKKGDGVTAQHRRHQGLGSSSDAADTDDPPVHHLRRHLDSDASAGDAIKSSKHAATWSSYDAQESAGEPVPETESAESPSKKLSRALMEEADVESTPSFNSIAPSSGTPASLPGDESSRYAWKRQIVTTTFWVGETPTHNNPVPNDSSCWDPHWARNYGGNDPSDAKERTSNYIPATFTPGQNPFYVALPYNDMEHGVHKAEAAQVIPWFAQDYKATSQSVCKGRWIAIRFGNRVCYAQWEDAGPFRTDNWQYVFGKERPQPNLNGGAGLDVSPAIRDYLGMNGSDVTDWKFVDFDEVPTGPWAHYGDNNTFVQNARKGGSQVAQVILEPQRPIFQGIAPGSAGPIVEIR